MSQGSFTACPYDGSGAICLYHSITRKLYALRPSGFRTDGLRPRWSSPKGFCRHLGYSLRQTHCRRLDQMPYSSDTEQPLSRRQRLSCVHRQCVKTMERRRSLDPGRRLRHVPCRLRRWCLPMDALGRGKQRIHISKYFQRTLRSTSSANQSLVLVFGFFSCLIGL